jgi:transposase
MMWLTGRLTPDVKTIADFRKDNGPAIRSACRQFVALCRGLNLFHSRDCGDRRQPVQGRQFP